MLLLGKIQNMGEGFGMKTQIYNVQRTGKRILMDFSVIQIDFNCENFLQMVKNIENLNLEEMENSGKILTGSPCFFRVWELSDQAIYISYCH